MPLAAHASSSSSASIVSFSDTQQAVEKIVGLIGFLDYLLEHTAHKPDMQPQWEGLFRVSPNEEEFQRWVALTTDIRSHVEMRQFLQSQAQLASTNSIQLSARLLKQLLSKLEFPIFAMDFAVEPVNEDDVCQLQQGGGETTQASSDRAMLGSVFADMFLHSVAQSSVPAGLAASYCVMAAQLFALLRHVSLESKVTKMDEYNLCVVLLPSVAGTRMDAETTLDQMMAEAAMLKQFQSNHREDKHCKFEMMVKYGRRIWGVVHAMSLAGVTAGGEGEGGGLEAELSEMRREAALSGGAGAKQPAQHRKSQVFSMLNNAKAGLMAARRPSSMHPRPSLAPSSWSTSLAAASASASAPPPPPPPPKLSKLHLSRSDSRALTSPPQPPPPSSTTTTTSPLQQQHSPAVSKALANSSRRRLSRGDSAGSASSSFSSSPFPPRPAAGARTVVQGATPLDLSAGGSNRHLNKSGRSFTSSRTNATDLL